MEDNSGTIPPSKYLPNAALTTHPHEQIIVWDLCRGLRGCDLNSDRFRILHAEYERENVRWARIP
ncbi:hypothetical protein KL938_003586, partial [Ogataea parapolymorpha]